MTAALFQPITLDGLTFPNRIAVAPMCQYSADDGSASDWHLYHWMNLAMSGAGMVTVEMTDVERRGRITHGCLGLYSDDNEAAARRTLDAARRVAAPGTKFGIQLAHAGRKASNRKPWEGGGPLRPGEDPWQTVSASAIAYDTGWNVPHALEDEEILQLIERFTEAARRAERAGFDFLELHAAHGYLIFQFLSPLSNRRTDRWGGSLENRMRFLLEIAKSVRKAVPNLMLGARLSVKDWVDGGFTRMTIAPPPARKRVVTTRVRIPMMPAVISVSTRPASIRVASIRVVSTRAVSMPVARAAAAVARVVATAAVTAAVTTDIGGLAGHPKDQLPQM
ncbi:oxidoreductase [Mesorhizobium caraganae]|uniref:oxidoreductase n=1 Tax=Mesorhizobium caraganae TaxID=483206 RepID=UPI0033375321